LQFLASESNLQQSKPTSFDVSSPPCSAQASDNLRISFRVKLSCDSEGEAISAGDQIPRSLDSELTVNEEPTNWYAVQTRARNEKVISERLQEQGLTTFLPLVREIRSWSDRKKKVELPLFSCYVFVKLAFGNNEARMRVYRTNGVFRIVSMGGQAIPIPEEQIEALRTVVTQQVSFSVHPFLKIGQRVRIRGGSLDGVEGVLLSRDGDRTLIISVDAIQRSLAVRVEGYDVEAL
jgi:transcription elongation factor/antiterminator RfaH